MVKSKRSTINIDSNIWQYGVVFATTIGCWPGGLLRRSTKQTMKELLYDNDEGKVPEFCHNLYIMLLRSVESPPPPEWLPLLLLIRS